MKKVLFTLLLPIMALAMGGCKKGPVAPTLSVSPSEDIVFEVTGGTARVRVTTNQAKWDASSNRSWCVVDKKTDDSAFEVKVGLNKSKEEMRGAQITVTAGEGENKKSVIVKVRQRGGKELFDITVSNIADTHADVNVVPLDPEENYFCDIIETSVIDKYYKGEVGNFVDALFKFAIDFYGTPEIAVAKLTRKGEQHKTIKELTPDSECFAYAVGIDAQAKRCTEIVSKMCHTNKTE